MPARFDAAARRAIDRAMIEVEERGHALLDTPHLLLGLTSGADTPAVLALVDLGVDVASLRAGADGLLLRQVASDSASVQIHATLDRVLARAHERSLARGAQAITDLDVLASCLDVPQAAAGSLLRDAGVDAEHLNALANVRAVQPPDARDEGPTSAVADYLSRAEAWTAAPPPAETTITRPQDRRSYPGLMSIVVPPERSLVTRVGNGYDSHRFGSPGPLILGGVAIPSDVRLVGHSDGDAVAHAVTDAILGACGAGDIGEMFADTDPANAGRDSIGMLRAAVDRIMARGWVVQQVDVTVITERPKIAPYRTAMRIRLAEALGITGDAVSVKGKTNEGMGWIGRGEGLACLAVATLVNAPDAAADG